MGTGMEKGATRELREEVREEGLRKRFVGKTGRGGRRRREGVRTSRGFRRWGLRVVLGPGRGAHGSREEPPKEERDPEHLDGYAAGGERPRAHPHGARPPGGDPGSLTRGDSPRAAASCSREPPLSNSPAADLTEAGSQGRPSAGAPEIRTKGRARPGASGPELGASLPIFPARRRAIRAAAPPTENPRPLHPRPAHCAHAPPLPPVRPAHPTSNFELWLPVFPRYGTQSPSLGLG